MSKSVTISLTDEQYEALRAAAERAQQTPEQLATDTIAARYSVLPRTPTAEEVQRSHEILRAVMRANGHLSEPPAGWKRTAGADLPPAGSLEARKLLDEIAEEASSAMEHMGIDISDLIER